MNSMPCPPNSVSALLAQLEDGVDTLHQPSISEATEENYFAAKYDFDFGDLPTWLNPPGLEAMPWLGARTKPRIHVWDIPRPILELEDPAKPIPDFLVFPVCSFVVSDKLKLLIEECEPGSLECAEVGFASSKPDQKYWLVMPRNSLEAVDVTKTAVGISHKTLNTDAIRLIRFAGNVVFDPDVTAGVCSFSDIDIREWFWSRELMARAADAGITGVHFAKAGDHSLKRVRIE